MLPGVVAYGLGALVMSDFVTDDALISLRYARNWAEGHGITWNPGEDPVEGFTNFSHVALGAAALRAGVSPLLCLRAVNVLASVGLVIVTYALARRMLGARAWAAAAALLVGAHPAFAYWSVSGLETSAYACALLLGVWAVHEQRPLLAWLALLAASLTRLEGAAVPVLVAGVQIATALHERRPAALRQPLLWLGAWLLSYGAYFAWRCDYFGYPLSNSAYYKSRGGGATLLLDFALHNAALLVLVPFAPYRRLGALGVTLLALLVLYAVGFYGVQPSVSYLHRFFLPVHAAAVLLAVSALHAWWSAAQHSVRRRRACMGGLALVLGWDLAVPGGGLATAYYEVAHRGSRMGPRAQVAAFVAERFAPDTAVAMQDVGLVGYLLHNPILDSFGLNDEAFIHELGRDRVRHVRALLGKKPGVIVLSSKIATRLQPIYGTDALIAKDQRFQAAYRLRYAAQSPPRHRYHYLIYARDELETRSIRGPPPLPIADRPSLAELIDRLAQRIWTQQRAEAVLR
jgi:hypothetical protein